MLTIVAGLAASFAGLMAPSLIGDIADTRMVLPTIAVNHVPFWIGLMVMIGVVGLRCRPATARSSQPPRSSRATSSSVGRWRISTTRSCLRYTRIVAVPMTIGGPFALYRPEPGLLLVLAFDILFAGCVVPLFAGVYWPQANSVGAVASIVCGTGARIAMNFLVPEELAGLDTLLPPVLSAIVFIPACLLTQSSQTSRHHVVGRPAEALAPHGD
ncbi:MAG: hypothetical protein R2724_14460 [Bryobacterales bacterium]